MIMKELLGLQPSASLISQYISSLAKAAGVSSSSIPEIRSYPDVVYFNYYPLGISLLFVPNNGYKPKMGLKLHDLHQEDLVLDSIDIYNVPGSRSSQSELAFTTYPISPIAIPIAARTVDQNGRQIDRPRQIEITPKSSGKDIVGVMGEPKRKGGGAGPSSGSINIWCEWTEDGVMVEFGGAQAKGPNAWDTGKDAVWKVITLFRPGMERS